MEILTVLFLVQMVVGIAAAAFIALYLRRVARLSSAGDRAHTETLAILTETLPYLRTGLNRESAGKTASLLLERLAVKAVSIVDQERVLAFVGEGSDHHRPGQPYLTELTKEVMRTGRPGVVRTRDGIGCPNPDCPLSSAVVVPLKVRSKTVGCLKFYQVGHGRLGKTEVETASSLAKLFSAHLELAELEASAARVAQAELEALRAQISPHFLYNTLTTIAALIRTDPDHAREMVIDFAHFFRETLKKHGELSTLAEELDYVEKYLSFERARLGPRLTVRYDIDPATLKTILPVLVVQPLVENAVAHGIEGKMGPGEIVIRSERRDGEDWITVTDNGVGIPAHKLHQVLEPGYGTGLGMGLSNVDQRLKSIYGANYGLHIESTEGIGTQVTIRIPWRSP